MRGSLLAMSETRLQVALDFVDLSRAMKVAEAAVAGGADLIEAGTPLIKSEGLDVVRKLRAAFPGKTWMTYSGCSAGNEDPKKDNLKPEYYEAFCDYLIDVCKFYKSEYGVEFKTLEPFNESTSAYWNYLGSQEGCHFEPETQIKIIRLLYSKLKASGLKTVISASDETNIKSTIRVLTEYQKAGDILSKVSQINTQTYSGTNDERKVANELVKSTGKEFCQMGQAKIIQNEQSGFFKFLEELQNSSFNTGHPGSYH